MEKFSECLWFALLDATVSNFKSELVSWSRVPKYLIRLTSRKRYAEQVKDKAIEAVTRDLKIHQANRFSMANWEHKNTEVVWVPKYSSTTHSILSKAWWASYPVHWMRLNEFYPLWGPASLLSIDKEDLGLTWGNRFLNHGIPKIINLCWSWYYIPRIV